MSDAAAYMNNAIQKARVIEGLPDDLALRPIAKVGIIGAGTMGGGIAMNFATAGIDVTIVETKEEALTRGLGVVRGNYQRPPIAAVFRKKRSIYAWTALTACWIWRHWPIAIW